MAVTLSRNTSGGISRTVLQAIADQRLAEFDMLKGTWFGAAIYLGGYACECLLKVRICELLDLAELPRTFYSHDLDALLLHAGLSNRIKAVAAVERSFQRIVSIWNDPHGQPQVRYNDPSAYTQTVADDCSKCLLDPNEGVVPWFKNQP